MAGWRLSVTCRLPSSRVGLPVSWAPTVPARPRPCGCCSDSWYPTGVPPLVGDPRVLILDEPANGLDPEGIVWMRALLRDLAAQGRTVVVSSHVLAEMEVLADDLVIIAEGSV